MAVIDIFWNLGSNYITCSAVFQHLIISFFKDVLRDAVNVCEQQYKSPGSGFLEWALFTVKN